MGLSQCDTASFSKYVFLLFWFFLGGEWGGICLFVVWLIYGVWVWFVCLLVSVFWFGVFFLKIK